MLYTEMTHMVDGFTENTSVYDRRLVTVDSHEC